MITNNQSLFDDWRNARFWWLFRTHAGMVSGEPLDRPYTGKLFFVTYVLQGKVTTFNCVTNDQTITREEAIEFCQKIYEGKFSVVSCDLSKL